MLSRQNVVNLLLLLSLGGCSTLATTSQRPDSYYNSAPAQAASLFAGDESVLSDEAIANILDYKYKAPPLSRIAVMPFGRETWSSWSEELAIATEETKAGLLGELRRSPRVYDASYLPSILIPRNRTVPYLREAAARYQADLLLVYRSYCQSFERYRLFSADSSRAFCGVEAILLDTRTGLVPFTAAATHKYEQTKNSNDQNFRETILKGQLSAVTTALSDVSGEIVRFLSEEQ